MNEYETEILINELQKLVVQKQLTINSQGYKIDSLKTENERLNKEVTSLKATIERLEHLLTPKAPSKEN